MDAAMAEAGRCVLLLGPPYHTTLTGSVRWTDALGNGEWESGLPCTVPVA